MRLLLILIALVLVSCGGSTQWEIQGARDGLTLDALRNGQPVAVRLCGVAGAGADAEAQAYLQRLIDASAYSAVEEVEAQGDFILAEVFVGDERGVEAGGEVELSSALLLESLAIPDNPEACPNGAALKLAAEIAREDSNESTD